MNKVAVIVGHEVNSPGFYSEYLGCSEYDWHQLKIVPGLENCDIFYRPNEVNGYATKMKALAKQLKGYDVAIELHFNGFKDTKANGSEVLHWLGNEQGMDIGNHYLELMSKLGFKNRGLKAIYRKDQRGYHFIQKMPCTALILEPFFGSNKNDTSLITPEKYINVLNQTIEYILKD